MGLLFFGNQVVEALMENPLNLRIGQFTDSYPPIINGVSAFISEHHHQLLEQGHEAFVFTFGYLKHKAPGVVRSFGFPYGPTQYRTNFFLSQPANKIARSLNIFHVHEPFGIGRLALNIAREHHYPMIYTNHTRHDLYVEHYPRPVQLFFQRHVRQSVAQFIRASAVSAAPSEDTARWMRSLAPDVADRVRVMHNGINLAAFDCVEKPISRREFGIPDDSTIFIYVGRLTPEKDLHVFASAFVEAVKAGADAYWIVVGEGRVQAALETIVESVKERVHFLGVVPREKIPAYLAMADVFATPSLTEVNPLSVIEAMAAGKPFLGLQSPWWDEFAEHERAGILTAHDTSSLVAGILHLCTDRAARLDMGIQAKRISHQFDIRTVTAQWLEIYERALSN
jgi:glycosyltransferase involved in cell wall biosynthesis